MSSCEFLVLYGYVIKCVICCFHVVRLVFLPLMSGLYDVCNYCGLLDTQWPGSHHFIIGMVVVYHCRYYQGAMGVLMMYDITSRDSYERVDKWMKDVREHGNANIVIMLVGNKCDLHSKREVPTEEAKGYAGRQRRRGRKDKG